MVVSLGIKTLAIKLNAPLIHRRSTMKDRHAVSSYSRRKMLLLTQGAMLLATPVGLSQLVSQAAGQTGDQGDWRFCNKCSGMFWNGVADKGHCPGGGGHAEQGWQFSLHFDSEKAGANMQYDWRFCGKCKSLFYDGDPNKAHCAGGGGHQAQGLMFGLHSQPPATGQNQKDWRFCTKCHVLFWDGVSDKGHCPAGGGHQAQGLMFYVSFIDSAVDPAKAIAEAVDQFLRTAQKPAEDIIKGLLGTPDMLGKGYSLHDINFHFGHGAVTVNRPNFDIKFTDNYLYTRVTQPTILGSYADPAFEVHFDAELSGTLIQGTSKPQLQNTVARIPRITVKPRDVTGALLTTAVRIFQMTEVGGRKIQQFMDQHMKIDLTKSINDYLNRF
jgi:hypothetical protein